MRVMMRLPSFSIMASCRRSRSRKRSVGPFDDEAVVLAQIGQLLLQRQGQERAEHVAADRGVAEMIDRPGPQDRFGTAEQVFHLQQIMVT